MPIEGLVSVDVRTVMLLARLEPLFPMVNPLTVIVNTDEGPMEAPEIVTVTLVMEVALLTAVRPVILLTSAVGVTDGARKPEG